MGLRTVETGSNYVRANGIDTKENKYGVIFSQLRYGLYLLVISGAVSNSLSVFTPNLSLYILLKFEKEGWNLIA